MIELGPAVLYNGETRDVMRRLVAEGVQVDSVVTDPPYEIGFMGRSWDSKGVAFDPETWRLALQLLKPGGHLLAFSGARTYHRMAVAIEDAGFEIRDQIMWVYGSGFPKSLDVAKAIDKAAGAEREIVGVSKDRRGDGTVYGVGHTGALTSCMPVTEAAARWQGWGTALKPAHEPLVLARKPLCGTVAATVLEHGTGALNIDGCRVETADVIPETSNQNIRGNAYKSDNWGRDRDTVYTPSALGRFPANLIHDGSPDVLAAFPSAPGQLATAATETGRRKTQNVYGAMQRGSNGAEPRDDLDKSAARFFYCAKASKADRGPGNDHPTVKPRALMRYLCRLITPPGGVTLDLFGGSGSTALGAVDEGFRPILIEEDEHNFNIACGRIAQAVMEANNAA